MRSSERGGNPWYEKGHLLMDVQKMVYHRAPSDVDSQMAR